MSSYSTTYRKINDVMLEIIASNITYLERNVWMLQFKKSFTIDVEFISLKVDTTIF